MKRLDNWQTALNLLALTAVLILAWMLGGCSTMPPVAQPVVRLPDLPPHLQKPLPPIPQFQTPKP